MKNTIKLLILATLALFTYTGISVSSTHAATPCFTKSVKASHILVYSKAEADAIKAKIDKGASFEDMAKQYSKCPSGENGGDLGYFGRGQMVKEFEFAAFDLPVGQVSDPVRTEFGWHIIKVYDKK